jgi:hypothetical protein
VWKRWSRMAETPTPVGVRWYGSRPAAGCDELK